jgi:hypothetical protein
MGRHRDEKVSREGVYGRDMGRANSREGVCVCVRGGTMGVRMNLPCLMRDETCPVSTEGWTRRVHFVREGGGGGQNLWDIPHAASSRCAPRNTSICRRTPHSHVTARRRAQAHSL